MTDPQPPADGAGEPDLDRASDDEARERSRRRRRRDAIFGDELPEGEAAGERDDDRQRDSDILRDVPPHHT